MCAMRLAKETNKKEKCGRTWKPRAHVSEERKSYRNATRKACEWTWKEEAESFSRARFGNTNDVSILQSCRPRLGLDDGWLGEPCLPDALHYSRRYRSIFEPKERI
jgi:hypothetical protein